jgi:SRSO17 transposase
MDTKQLYRLHAELTAFLDELMPDRLGNVTRRRWAEVYLRGLLLDGQRKSIEPMAQRLRDTDGAAADYEQALQQFINQSPWEDRPVRDRLVRRVLAAVAGAGSVIVADTDFPKQGTSSVGVARQCCGTPAKVGNCQVAVTLQYATEQEVFALDAELYLPEEWGSDRDRLDTAGVPADIGYRPKWEIALALLRRAQANGLNGTVLADSAYGDGTELRQALDDGGWPYCVGISSTLKVVAADHDFGQVPPYSGKGRLTTRPARAQSVQKWARTRAKEFRRVTWREGSKGRMSSRFAAWRVRPAHRRSAGPEPLAACWLVVEWPEGEAEPTKYFFSKLAGDASLRRLVRTAKGSWWAEHSYKELKDELGLDHFEGRSWRGWHHHVTLVLLAYTFLVLRRRRRRKKGSPTA